MEHLVSQQWQDRSLLAEGAADQSVDGNEQHELGDVLSQAQRDGGAGSFHLLVSRPRSAACIQSTGPLSRTATSVPPMSTRGMTGTSLIRVLHRLLWLGDGKIR